MLLPWMDKGKHGLAGQKYAPTASSPLTIQKYALRLFSCLAAFLLRKTARHLPAMDFRVILFFEMQAGCVGIFPPMPSSDVPWERDGARQDEKDKKRRKDTLPGVIALVRQWYYNTFRSDLFEQAVKFFINISPAADPVTGCPPRSSRGPSAAGLPPSAASAPPARPR